MAVSSKDLSNGNSNSQNKLTPAPTTSGQDDNGVSYAISGQDALNGVTTSSDLLNTNTLKSALHSSNLYTREEIKTSLYTKTYRFGLINPYGALSNTREYLFFTKPDLHILQMDDYGSVISQELNEHLGYIPFWIDLWKSRRNTTIPCLQNSLSEDPFNHLLQNQVSSNLEIPSLSSETIDTPTNMYGVGYSYRGSSEASDDNPEFSLEFKDTRYLDTYYFFKAYEEYETLKHHGVIAPSKYYTVNKILHDQFSIYKFLVDDDMETIVYFGKMYGVFPKSLPRDTFSNPNFDNGLSYSIDFKAAFYEELKPDILSDFNALSLPLYNKQPYQISPYNSILDHPDMRPAEAACVVKEYSAQSPLGYVYKLKWRGSGTI